jgi:hypothetical protein
LETGTTTGLPLFPAFCNPGRAAGSCVATSGTYVILTGQEGRWKE